MNNTPTERSVEIPWGLRGAVPADASAAWGARAIYRERIYVDSEFDLVWDRQGAAGDPAERSILVGKLNDGLLEDAQSAVGKAGMRDDEQRQVELVRKDGVVIVGDTLASCGYLYLAAWMEASR